MIFTTILHTVRKRFGISCNDYCVVDAVYFAQNSPKSKMVGWCTLSRQDLADELDLSRQTIITILKKLKDLGLIEENENSFLKTSALWFEAVMDSKSTTRKETLHPVKKLDTPLSNNFTPSCKETLHHPVKKLDTPPLVKENKLNNYTSPMREREVGDDEAEKVSDWRLAEKVEMTAVIEAKQEIPPKVAPKAPPYFWADVLPELTATAYLERVYFQSKQLMPEKKPDAALEHIKSRLETFQYVFNDEYPEGVPEIKRAKEYFSNWILKTLKKNADDQNTPPANVRNAGLKPAGREPKQGRPFGSW